MKRCLLAILLLLLPGTTAFCAEDAFGPPLDNRNEAAFAKVIHSLKIRHPLTVSFVQEKQIAALGRPLVSSGVMHIAQGGVCWLTEKPLRSAMSLSPEGIAHRSAGGSTEFRSAEDHAEIRYFSKIMMALFLARREVLEDEFHVFFKKGANGWQIGLRPDRRMVAKLLKGILIEGDEKVSRVTILEANGDRTAISFEPANHRQMTLADCVP